MKCVLGESWSKEIFPGDVLLCGASGSNSAVITPGPGQFGICCQKANAAFRDVKFPAGVLGQVAHHGSADLLRNPMKLRATRRNWC